MNLGGQSRNRPLGRVAQSLRGRFSRLFLISGVAFLATGCFVSERGSNPDPDDSRDKILLNIRMGVGSVKALGKSSTITLNKLILVFTSSANDTIRDTITSSTSPALNTVATSSQNVSKSYTLKALRSWKVIATSRDTQDSIIHLDSATIPALYAGYTANVNLNLSSRYTMFEAKFLSLPDSIESATPSQPKQKLLINRLVLKIDGQTVRDSTRAKFDSLTTHTLAYDYVRGNAGIAVSALTSGTSNRLGAVHFPTADTGYLVGNDVVLKSVNGGLTWSPLTPGGTSKVYNAVSFLNGRTGVIVGGNDSMVIRRTTDGGATWSTPYSFVSALFKMRCVHLVNDTGWAIPADNTLPTGNSPYYRTTDAGATWTGVTVLEHAYTVRGVNGTTAWAAGPGGMIRKNTSGAGTFTTLQTSGTTKHLRSIFPVNANLVYVVGDSGTILRTVNGGTTWVTKTSGTTVDLHGVWFLDPATGFAAGEGGKVFRTADSGNTWIAVTSPTTEPFYGIGFYGGKGFAVGYLGTLVSLTGYKVAELQAFGPMGTWNVANPLFSGTKAISTLQGVNDTLPLTLNWVGPSTGTGTINATIGKVGKISIIGNLPGTNL